MKDSEFLELLNSYLDHEITAADAARLEAELQGSVERRKVYREYCRMQKACKIAADRMLDTLGADCEHGGKVVPFTRASNPKRYPATPYLIASALATAACVAVAFLTLQRDPTPGKANDRTPQGFAAQTDKGAGSGAPAPLAIDGKSSSTPRPVQTSEEVGAPLRLSRVSLVVEPLVLSGGGQLEVMRTMAAPQSSDIEQDQLAWVRNLQLVSLQQKARADQLRFEAAPVTLRPEGRHLGGRTSLETTVEMTSFRFVK